MSRLILRIEVFPSLRPPPRGIYSTAQHENYLKTIFPIRSIKVSPLYPKQLYRSVQYGATAPKNTATVCPVHNFLPPSELLVCYQPHRQTAMPGQKSIYETFLVSTSTGISGCYQPHRQTAMPGQKSTYETFLCAAECRSSDVVT
jgi:hypothetical protein